MWRMGQIGAALLVAALALGGCGARRVGIVDTQRILDESVAALRYQKQLDDKEKEYAIDLQMLAQTGDKTELAARRAEYVRELERLRRDYEARLNDELRGAAEAVAKAQRLSLVVVKGMTPYGGTDITQAVIDQMK